jgi:hypothetical protein
MSMFCIYKNVLSLMQKKDDKKKPRGLHSDQTGGHSMEYVTAIHVWSSKSTSLKLHTREKMRSPETEGTVEVPQLDRAGPGGTQD